MRVPSRCILASAFAAIASLSPARADSVADFYRGKTINLLIGSGSGGGYDIYGRALARFLGKHVPGNPAVVSQNVLGGGGIKMLDSLYNIVPKDGTYIGTATPISVLAPLLGDKDLTQYSPVKFTWLGNMDKDSSACGAWRTSGVVRFDDTFKRQVTFGASTKESVFYQQALVLRELLGAKIKIVTGYINGMNEIGLAMRRGEVDAVCSLYESTVKASLSADVAGGDLRFIIQFGDENDPYFGDAVNVHQFLKTDEQRNVADIIFRQSEITRPFMAPPGLPADIASALKAAFMETMRDPEFLEYAKSIHIDIKPTNGDDVGRQIASFFDMPDSVIQRAKSLINGN